MSAFGGHRGSVLIMALWILAILVLLSLGFGYAMSLELKLVGYQRDQLLALSLAKAGYRRAVAAVPALASAIPPLTDAYPDPWFSSPEAFQEVALGQGRYTVSVRIREGGDTDQIVYGAMDEDRKINLNTASKLVLVQLPEMTEEAADSLLDWVDLNPFPRLLGAEDFYYRGLEPPYRAKNYPVEVMEELLLVKGFTDKILHAIKPFVTIYTDGKVNVNTAPREVLMALGMSSKLADKIVRFRQGLDGLSMTKDDQRFENLAGAPPALNAVESLTPQEAAQLTNVITLNLLKVTSQVFLIHAEGTVRDGKIVRSVEAVVKRGVARGPAPPPGVPPARAPTPVVLSWWEG